MYVHVLACGVFYLLVIACAIHVYNGREQDCSQCYSLCLSIHCLCCCMNSHTFIPSGKKGPIYAVEWNPNSEEFCVVYGCILYAVCVMW